MPHLGTTGPTTDFGGGAGLFPLCLGGNVFGWTADREDSFAVLDAYVAAGGNLVDTADTYSSWVEGHEGGESERLLGEWMATHGTREQVMVATKVGAWERRPGLSAANVRVATEDSLTRLRTDRIDLLYAHRDDADTPLEETLGAFDELVRHGLVRFVGLSNYSPERLAEALAVAERESFARPVAFQPGYSLADRGYEDGARDVCRDEGLGCLPYSALASGFLSGKYRPDGPPVDSPRAGGAGRLAAEPRGRAILEALDAIAEAHGVPVPAVALAWLAAQDTVVAPIASARTPDQLAELLPMASLELAPEELARLSAASAG